MKKIVLLVLLVASISFSGFINYWVDPFFENHGFSLYQNVSFWKINALLRYDLNVSWKQGFAFVFPRYPEITFDLVSENYLIQYGYFHEGVPFSTYVNPVDKGLNLKWGFVGFYNEYQYFSSEIIDMIISENFCNFSLKMDNYGLFFEKSEDEISFGTWLNGIVLYKKNNDIKMGLNLNLENTILYFLPFDNKLGFVIRNEQNYLFLTNKEATFSLKWGELIFFGKLEDENKIFRIEFPIWWKIYYFMINISLTVVSRF